jgi:hypothetical protein
MAWKPKVTVAVVIEHDCKILLIEEHTMLFDQPTDHLEPNESLQRAEVLKESAYEFKPQLRLCMALPTLHLRRKRPRPLLGTAA